MASNSWRPLLSVGNAEALAGMRAAPAVEARYGGVTRDPHAERRMSRIARRLVQAAPYRRGSYQCRLLDSEQIDAVSLPGGYIYVTRALYRYLDRNDLLSAALAHEMAHLAAKDHFKKRPSNARGALEKELAADLRAAHTLDSAGIGRTALIELVLLIADTQPEGWAEARIGNLSSAILVADNVGALSNQR